jgi:hypothetical protein
MHGTSAPGVKNVAGAIETGNLPKGPYKYEKTHATFGQVIAKPDPKEYLKGQSSSSTWRT